MKIWNSSKTRSFIMNPPEAVRSPVVIVFLRSIKKCGFRDIELVKKELGIFYRTGSAPGQIRRPDF